MQVVSQCLQASSTTCFLRTFGWTLPCYFLVHYLLGTKSSESELERPMWANSHIWQNKVQANSYSGYIYVCFSTDQEGAEEDKRNEVEVGKITAALLPMGPWLLVTGSVAQTWQHDLVPGFASCTPDTHKNTERKQLWLKRHTFMTIYTLFGWSAHREFTKYFWHFNSLLFKIQQWSVSLCSYLRDYIVHVTIH